jgi:hypothetical protein
MTPAADQPEPGTIRSHKGTIAMQRDDAWCLRSLGRGYWQCHRLLISNDYSAFFVKVLPALGWALDTFDDKLFARLKPALMLSGTFNSDGHNGFS